MQQQQVISLRGGLDLVSPAIEVAPGRVIAAQNYESAVEGYARIAGYERFDGQPSPSKAIVAALGFETGTTEPSVGDLITGATSAATGYLIEAPTVTAGSWGGNDAAGSIQMRHVSGTFVDGENLQVSASTFAAADGTTNTAWSTTDSEAETARRLAISLARAEIAAMPGSGGVRGIFTYAGDVYAVRDNAGATASILFKATSSGWVAQTLGETVDFTTGTAEFAEGETLTGGISAATATIERIVRTSGEWASNNAAGYLVLSGVSGTFQAETVTSATGSAMASGASAAITLPAGGRVRTTEHNFGGLAGSSRVYAASGVGYAWEWDGSVLTPIRTGVAANLDKPSFVAVLSEHLILGYAIGSIQNSGIGKPLSYDVNDGAGEIGFGQTMTGMKGDVRGSVIVTGLNRVSYLTGTSTANFDMQVITDDSGAEGDTLEMIGQPHFLDKQGVRSLESTQAYGNWNVGTITRDIEPLIREKRGSNIYPIGALRVRSKDQYRLFYGDGTVISIYFGRQNPESMPLLMGFTPTCLCSGSEADGNEILLAGADDGFVYQLDAGTSADGSAIEAYMATSYLHVGAPNTLKRFHRAFLEMIGGSRESDLKLGGNFAYGSDEGPSTVQAVIEIEAGGGLWDIAKWDLFQWSGTARATPTAKLEGIGENVSVTLFSEATHDPVHTLSNLTINYTKRRQKR